MDRDPRWHGKVDRMHRAVATMTAWLEARNHTEENPQFFAELTARYLVEDDVGYVSGLGSLAGILLLRLEKATGRPAQEILQDIAVQYASGGPEAGY